MPSKPGEYCARCGRKSNAAQVDGMIIYSCADHGIQGVIVAPDQPQPAAVADQGIDDVASMVRNCAD